jgi:hypothetical protein
MQHTSSLQILPKNEENEILEVQAPRLITEQSGINSPRHNTLGTPSM